MSARRPPNSGDWLPFIFLGGMALAGLAIGGVSFAVGMALR